MKSKISTFSGFKLYILSTVFFGTLKTRSEKNLGAGLVPAKSTRPEPVRDLSDEYWLWSNTDTV